MFGIAPSELMIVALVAIVLIGPRDLPRVMRVVGQWVGKGRAVMRQVHGAIDDMMREAEMEESARESRAQTAQIVTQPVTGVADSTSTGPPPVIAEPAIDRPVLAVMQG